MRPTMGKKETLKDKAYHLWKSARLPKYLNRKGPKRTPGWKVLLAYFEYTTHAPAWRRARQFMSDYYDEKRHFTTWQKAIQKWPAWVWDALAKASAETDICPVAAIDGTGLSRTNASQHYLKRIDSDYKIKRHAQAMVMVDVERRKFLSWRFRAVPRGEKCDVPYLIRHSPTLPDLVLMDKGFDSQPLHEWLRNEGIWSVAPVRKNCRRGRYRKQLRDCFDYGLYWQRNIVECLIGVVKRLFGSHVRARHARMQRAEFSIRLIAYNIGAISKRYFLQSPSALIIFKVQHHIFRQYCTFTSPPRGISQVRSIHQFRNKHCFQPLLGQAKTPSVHPIQKRK